MKPRERRPQRLTHIQRRLCKIPPVANNWACRTDTRETVSLIKRGPVKYKACLQQIKWRRFFLSYARSQCLWHCAFRQSLSFSFVVSLIYSFKRLQPYSKTMAHKLWVELTSIIMQFWGNKSPIVRYSSRFLPPSVLNIQLNRLITPRKIQPFPLKCPLRSTGQCTFTFVFVVFASHPPRSSFLFMFALLMIFILSLMEASIHCECICKGSIFSKHHTGMHF